MTVYQEKRKCQNNKKSNEKTESIRKEKIRKISKNQENNR